MERLQKPLTSPGSVCSSRGSSVPGSPSSIVAKMDNEVLGYKDLAAIPKDKAILDIERPDLMIYEPHFTYSLMEHVELPRSRERSLSPKSMSPPPSPEVIREWLESRPPSSTPLPPSRQGPAPTRSSVQHFHRPETDTTELNIYKKPPIYRQKDHHSSAHHGKHLIEDLIIESSKFPAAQPPDPNQPAKIETDYWPCPPSLAVVETEWRRRMASKRGEEEDEDLTEEMKNLRELQRQELSKVTSNLGKLILKEEMEKSLPIRRKTRSLPDRTPFHTSLHTSSKSSSLPASGRSTLTRLQSAEFGSAGSEKGSPERPAGTDGQRELPAQHAGAEDLPLRDADGDEPRPSEAPARRGQDQAGAPPVPRGFPQGVRDVAGGVWQAGAVEAQRAEEESLPLLSPPPPPPPRDSSVRVAPWNRFRAPQPVFIGVPPTAPPPAPQICAPQNLRPPNLRLPPQSWWDWGAPTRLARGNGGD
ncbi:dematin isoform X2 [Ammospiza nelsoni]|uniref:dematin isoform X2 n=1 Tax=Ammospiza nelsoni TaxID=2857394 RepID=UPI00286CB8EF|nr:dematin isoform X2 [Ammospiza nelsoni]XP_059346771.1 dematin isoform X2 [Ammospiza nelsoni]